MTAADKAYQLMTLKADELELKYGERTNVETVYEGSTSFKYSVMFCSATGKVVTKTINISIKGYTYTK